MKRTVHQKRKSKVMLANRAIWIVKKPLFVCTVDFSPQE